MEDNGLRRNTTYNKKFSGGTDLKEFPGPPKGPKLSGIKNDTRIHLI